MPTTQAPNIVDVLMNSGLIREKTRRAVAHSLDSVFEDGRSRPTAKECIESASAFGGSPHAVCASWGFVIDADTGSWLDVLSEPEDSDRIGLVRDSESMHCLTVFVAMLRHELRLRIIVGKYQFPLPKRIRELNGGIHAADPGSCEAS